MDPMRGEPYDFGSNPSYVDGYVRQLMQDAGVPDHHGFPHVERTTNMAIRIAKAEGLSKLDRWAVSTATCLHDIGRTRELQRESADHVPNGHACMSAEMARKLLVKGGPIDWGSFDHVGSDCPLDHDNIVETIITAIAEHSDKEPASSEIGRILQDADKLDTFGLTGLGRIIGHWTSLDFSSVYKSLLSAHLLDTIEREQVALLIREIKHCEQWYPHMLNTQAAKQHGLAPWAELRGYRVTLEWMLTR